MAVYVIEEPTWNHVFVLERWAKQKNKKFSDVVEMFSDPPQLFVLIIFYHGTHVVAPVCMGDPVQKLENFRIFVIFHTFIEKIAVKNCNFQQIKSRKY